MRSANSIERTNSEHGPQSLSLELIEGCREAKPAALRSFFEIYAQEIYNFPIKVFHLDEDAASDFFLYAYDRLQNGSRFRSFQKRSSFRTWFYTVLRNLVIDWMRTLREIDFVDVNRSNDKDQEYDLISNTADPRSLKKEDDSFTSAFCKRLKEVTIEMRIVFKLSYIYYLDLEQAEIEYIVTRYKRSSSQVLEDLLQLRHELVEKELKNISAEDKLTSLYLSIVELKAKKEGLAKMAEKQSTPEGSILVEIERLERIINKKYEQRKRLLHKKSRGHFVVRTPYRRVAGFLETSEGNVSVQMMRILERLRAVKAA